jgi:cell wall assembly regulator SMI1
MTAFITPKLAGEPCTPADIQKFEKFANASLPSDYAEFLLAYNGCIPASKADTFHSSIELPGGNQITVHQLFSLSSKSPPLRSLYAELEADVGFMPMTSIPIGEDSFGNVIGLDCETGLLNWTLCEERFPLDYLRNYELGVSFTKFMASLLHGPYEGTD